MKIKLTIVRLGRIKATITKEVQAESIEKAKLEWLDVYINKQTHVLDVYSVPLAMVTKTAKVSIKAEIIEDVKKIMYSGKKRR